MDAPRPDHLSPWPTQAPQQAWPAQAPPQQPWATQQTWLQQQTPQQWPIHPGHQSPARARHNVWAGISLLAAVLGLFVGALILGPIAIVTGAIGLSTAGPQGGARQQAIWGMLLGLAVTLLGLWALLALL